jgi:hypothetical protein
MKNLLENARVLSAVVGNIENCERSFQDKGLESLSVSLNKNETNEVIVDIVGSFDVDKVLEKIQEDIILYGGDKFLPHGEDKFSFIFEQMKEVRKTFNYMIESFQVSFNSDKEGRLIMDVVCSLNASKFRKKGNEVLSFKRKKLTSLDYEKISREVEKSCEKISKETSEHLKKCEKEMKKEKKCEEEMKKERDLDSKKYKAFSEDLFNEIFGDKGDLK